jgi:hypothetical protein
MSETAPTWRERLLERTRKTGNTLCVGLDPVLDKLPAGSGSPADRIRRFYASLLEAAARRGGFAPPGEPHTPEFEGKGGGAPAPPPGVGAG